MNLCKIAELETALKDLLVYNLTPKDESCPSVVVSSNEPDQSMAFHLASENYSEVLKIGKENVWNNLPSSWTTPEDLKTALSSFLANSSLER